MAFTVLADSSELKNIIDSGKIVIVQFAASWSGPSRTIKPFMERVGNDDEGIDVVYVDVDAHGSLSPEYGVRGVPMFLFYRDGIEFGNRITGADRAGIEQQIKSMKS